MHVVVLWKTQCHPTAVIISWDIWWSCKLKPMAETSYKSWAFPSLLLSCFLSKCWILTFHYMLIHTTWEKSMWNGAQGHEKLCLHKASQPDRTYRLVHKTSWNQKNSVALVWGCVSARTMPLTGVCPLLANAGLKISQSDGTKNGEQVTPHVVKTDFQKP